MLLKIKRFEVIGMYEMNDCVSVVEKRRADYGMTVRALSQKSGVREDALYNILGKKRKMTASELLSISAVLNLTFEDYRPKEAV